MRAATLATVVLALALPAHAASSTEPKTTLPDVADEVMCTVCGVLLDEAPDAPQAERQREFIARLIAQGRTKDEIKDALVAEYGEQVLAEPGTSGFDLFAWLVPGLAVAAAAVGIAVALRRWRRAGREPGDRPQPDAIDPADRARLDSDLAKYDL